MRLKSDTGNRRRILSNGKKFLGGVAKCHVFLRAKHMWTVKRSVKGQFGEVLPYYNACIHLERLAEAV